MKAFHSQDYADLIRGIVDARHDANLTQQDVADRLGKPQSFVAKVEGSERRLDIAEFVDFAHALSRDPVDLLQTMLRANG